MFEAILNNAGIPLLGCVIGYVAATVYVKWAYPPSDLSVYFGGYNSKGYRFEFVKTGKWFFSRHNGAIVTQGKSGIKVSSLDKSLSWYTNATRAIRDIEKAIDERKRFLGDVLPEVGDTVILADIVYEDGEFEGKHIPHWVSGIYALKTDTENLDSFEVYVTARDENGVERTMPLKSTMNMSIVRGFGENLPSACDLSLFKKA